MYNKFSLGFFYPRSDYSLTADQANGLLDISSCVPNFLGSPAVNSQDDLYKIYIKTKDQVDERISVVSVHRGGLVDYELNN